MAFRFDVKKAAQVVAKLLHLAGKDHANLMWTLKLIYIADRESLRQYGTPISGDEAWALPNGPVPTTIYDLFKPGHDFPSDEDDPEVGAWRKWFQRDGYTFAIREDPGDGELAPFEEAILRQVVAAHGAKSQFELVDLTHEFPEWRTNQVRGSSARIPLADILEAVGRADSVEMVIQAQREEAYFDRLFGSRR